MSDIFYFGVRSKEERGHHLYTSGLSQAGFQESRQLPFRAGILDGGLLNQNDPKVEGKAVIIYFPGWTVISFWDRSADPRENSNSAFVIKGRILPKDALRIAERTFPTIFARFTFEIKFEVEL
jgi:hypothetical protein